MQQRDSSRGHCSGILLLGSSHAPAASGADPPTSSYTAQETAWAHLLRRALRHGVRGGGAEAARQHGRRPARGVRGAPALELTLPLIEKVYTDEFKSSWDYAVRFFDECAVNVVEIPEARLAARDRVRAAGHDRVAGAHAEGGRREKDSVYAYFAKFPAESTHAVIDAVYAKARDRSPGGRARGLERVHGPAHTRRVSRSVRISKGRSSGGCGRGRARRDRPARRSRRPARTSAAPPRAADPASRRGARSRCRRRAARSPRRRSPDRRARAGARRRAAERSPDRRPRTRTGHTQIGVRARSRPRRPPPWSRSESSARCGPSACAPGVSNGGPAWPRRSARSPRERKPTARSRVTASELPPSGSTNRLDLRVAAVRDA